MFWTYFFSFTESNLNRFNNTMTQSAHSFIPSHRDHIYLFVLLYIYITICMANVCNPVSLNVIQY